MVGILALTGVVWGYVEVDSKLEAKGCNFHEHATFRVVDEGQVLSFKHPRFDMSNMAMKAHLHQPNDSQIHLEGKCASVDDFFSLMGMKIEPGLLQLDHELHGGKVLEDEGNRTLRFFLYHETPDDWKWEEYPGLLDHQLRDGQRMLVIYGEYTDEEITAFQDQVPRLE